MCISIGTGASCIYPLLGATMNGWYFLATEVDDICFDYATKNVEQNKMSDLIKGECGPGQTRSEKTWVLSVVYYLQQGCCVLISVCVKFSRITQKVLGKNPFNLRLDPDKRLDPEFYFPFFNMRDEGVKLVGGMHSEHP